MFGESRVLFVDEIFYRLNELRDVEVDFGIVPYPLFDDTQAEYYSRVEAGARIGMIPITNKHPEYAGALLEAMASYGYQNLIPEYYEVALKRRTSRDSESSEMLDLIFATRRYDLGDTWWCNDLRDGLFKNMFAEDDRDLSRAVSALLKHAGYTVDAVYTGPDALDYAAGGDFTKNIDDCGGEGTAAFASRAIEIYCGKD